MMKPRRPDPEAPAEHEAECRRCGQCCSEKYIVGGVVFSTRRYCEYWDPATHLCRVYDRRQDVNPHCLDVDTGIRLGVFPPDCPYVRDVAGYMPPYPLFLDDATEEAIVTGEVQTADEVIRRLTTRARVTTREQCDAEGDRGGR